MDNKVLTDIHRYWFGPLKSPTDTVAEAKSGTWFRQSDDIDATIRDRFGKYIDAAAAARWDTNGLSGLSREQQIALVILLDQFPRNIFRDTSEAFAHDATARALAGALIANGLERYFVAERSFLIMPFMHSEDVADQDYCVSLFAEQALTAALPHKESFRAGLDFATKHRDIVRKFGSFPHRNAMLGRVSTAEEVEFLKGGRGF